MYRFDAALFFVNAEYMRQRVLALVDAGDDVEWLVLNAEAWTYLDATAIDMLEQLHSELADRGVTVVVARLKGRQREIFRETELTAKIGAGQFFPTVRSALDAFESRPRSPRAAPRLTGRRAVRAAASPRWTQGALNATDNRSDQRELACSRESILP